MLKGIKPYQPFIYPIKIYLKKQKNLEFLRGFVWELIP